MNYKVNMEGEGDLATRYEGIVLGDEDLIMIEIDTQIPEEVSEVIKILSVKLLEKGYVTDKFRESVISREKSFLTELSTIILFQLHFPSLMQYMVKSLLLLYYCGRDIEKTSKL